MELVNSFKSYRQKTWGQDSEINFSTGKGRPENVPYSPFLVDSFRETSTIW